MPTGLQLIGQHTYAQIDETYRNLQFKAKGSFTCTTSTGAGVASWYNSVTVTANAFPMIAVRSSSLVGFIGFTVSGSSYTFYYASPTNGATVEWYHFDTPNPGDTANYLEVIDSAGNRVFNGLGKPMRIVASVDPNSAGSETYTSGKKYAALQTGTGWSFVETLVGPMGGAGTFKSWSSAQSWSADNVAAFRGSAFTSALQIDNNTSGAQDAQEDGWPQVKFIVVDVTGY